MTLIERRPPPLVQTAKSGLSDIDIATTRPGTPGGIFMRQFWHALYRSQDLPTGQAKPIRIMSEDFALYRGQSGQRAGRRLPLPASRRADASRLDRGGRHPLRLSRLEVRLLAANASISRPRKRVSPARSKMRTYPTREYLGLIFGYFGPGEPPPFPHYPHRSSRGA